MNSRADLNECDKEPIHLSQSIQNHGFFLAINKETDQVDVISANTFHFFGRSHEELLGEHVSELFSLETLKIFKRSCRNQHFGLSFLQEYEIIDFENKELRFYACLNESGDHYIVDLEPVVHSDQASSFPFVLEKIQSFDNQQDLLAFVVREIKRIFRFDRVMYYDFLINGDGLVKAEELEPDVPSFLGHRFPASDIPKQARALYIKNKIRLIGDVESSVVKLKALEGVDLSTFDLSASMLRSVSPIHIEYMQNMGIQSSLSISIVSNGTLRGMFIAHAISSRYVGLKTRSHALSMCNALSLMLN